MIKYVMSVLVTQKIYYLATLLGLLFIITDYKTIQHPKFEHFLLTFQTQSVPRKMALLK